MARRERIRSSTFMLFPDPLCPRVGVGVQNIKELNAHRQTREETLRKAADIFGPTNGDLYASFESLLSRHLPL